MEPDRSSRVAARRIVEEVLADHAARATALDGAKPVTIVERPDTPSWRAARRIVEETLAEHAARAVVPAATQLDVVVDLEERDIEVVVDLDGQAPTTGPSEPGVVSVVAPIEPDETPAKSARRVVEGVLTDHAVEPDEPTDPPGAPRAFEIDPTPEERPEPTAPTTTGVAAAFDPSEDVDPHDRGDPEAPDEAEPTGDEPTGDEPTGDEPTGDEPTEPEVSPAPDDVDVVVVPVDDERLRAAIPERLFGPDPEPTDADAQLDEPPALDEPSVAPSVDGPPPPRTPEAVPPAPADPDAPDAIAARIVEGVLADQERAAQEAKAAQEAQEAKAAREAQEAQEAQEAKEAREALEALEAEEAREAQEALEALEALEAEEAREAQEARDAERVTLEEETAGSEPPEQAAAQVPDTDTGPVSPDSEAQPPGLPDGWAVVPSASDGVGPGSPSGVMIVDATVEDLPAVDPVVSDQQVADPPAEVTDGFWTGQEAADPVTEDEEFGAWPEPIAPPRRTGRWLITTVLGAVLLAVLLPLAIGALRNLVSFS